MDLFLRRPEAERREFYAEAGRRLSMQPASVEKDFWVCWTLRALVEDPRVGARLTFKGGTSLSKGWRLIERFSEDIDLVIDRDFLGFGGRAGPEAARISQKERARRLAALKHVCHTCVREQVAFGLRDRLARVTDAARVVEDASDPDGLTLLLEYPSAVAAGSYLRPIVKVELGARSDTEPSNTPTIAPYVADVFPGEIDDPSFPVRTVAPERTFWEKVALLHDEGFRTAADDGPKARLARHYYDVWALIRGGVAERALADAGLFGRVAAHREVFFRRSRQAQESLRPGTLRIVPRAERRAGWKRDYDAMREAMFFGEPPRFDEILAVVAAFEQRFNGTASEAG